MIELGPLAGRLNQPHIIIPIDLEHVQTLEPGATWTTMADGGATVYVVMEDTKTVYVLSIAADHVVVSAENIP